MLPIEFYIQAILKLTQYHVLVARDGHSCGLIASRVDFDLMLERVVVEVIFRALIHLSALTI